jgi:hypothetical protein
MLLMDLAKWRIGGGTASALLEEAHLSVNKNKIEFDIYCCRSDRR